MHSPLRSARTFDSNEVSVAEDRRTFEDFFLAERDRLYSSLCLVTGDRFEAEEIMQEAFLRLWERWDRVSGLEDPTGFLYRTAMNVFRNRYRRAVLALRRVMSQAPNEDAFASVDDRDVLVRALRGVVPRQRAAIVLTALLGYSSEEAGRMLGMQAPAVRVLASRARTAMKGTIGERR
jgi:RNA polymerase sigma-70 factor (ECF subfamily)